MGNDLGWWRGFINVVGSLYFVEALIAFGYLYFLSQNAQILSKNAFALNFVTTVVIVFLSGLLLVEFFVFNATKFRDLKYTSKVTIIILIIVFLMSVYNFVSLLWL